MKLTKTRIDAFLREPNGRERFLRDDEIRGFALRVTAAGAASWTVQYRTAAGRSRRLTLGRLGSLTPAQARDLARRELAAVAAGNDPADERRKARTAPGNVTFADFAARWYEEHVSPRLKPTTRSRYELTLRLHINPAFGKVPIDEIEREHVARLHHAMRKSPVSANRARAVVSAICNHAERVGLRPQGSNPARWVTPYREQRRRRFLDAEELARLGRALDEVDSEGIGPCDRSAVAAIRLLLTTGARLGEILSLEWPHVDLEGGALRLPDSKTGAKEIAIGKSARAILEALPRTSRYVIAGRDTDAPLVGLRRIWLRILRRAEIDPETIRIHDLRRTAASAGASVGLTLETVGQLLGHTQADTTKRYAFIFDEAKREAAEKMDAAIATALRREPKAKAKILAIRA
jgi:integrase